MNNDPARLGEVKEGTQEGGEANGHMPLPPPPSPQPNFITFYTKSYQHLSQGWIDSCERLGLARTIEAVPDLGGWELNCGGKPNWIMGEWRKCQSGVVWVDVDGRINSEPKILLNMPPNVDFACHFRNQTLCSGTHYENELMSGTLYFGPTQGAFRLLSAWVDEQNENPRELDQRTLQKALNRLSDLTIFKLPKSYCKVFDTMDGEAVIEHFQESRKRRVR